MKDNKVLAYQDLPNGCEYQHYNFHLVLQFFVQLHPLLDFGFEAIEVIYGQIFCVFDDVRAFLPAIPEFSGLFLTKAINTLM